MFVLAAKPRESDAELNFSNFVEDIDPEKEIGDNIVSPVKIDIQRDRDRLSNIAMKEVADK